MHFWCLISKLETQSFSESESKTEMLTSFDQSSDVKKKKIVLFFFYWN